MAVCRFSRRDQEIFGRPVRSRALGAEKKKTQIEETCATRLELPLLVRRVVYSFYFVSTGGRVCGLFPSRSSERKFQRPSTCFFYLSCGRLEYCGILDWCVHLWRVFRAHCQLGKASAVVLNEGRRVAVEFVTGPLGPRKNPFPHPAQ